MMCDEGVAWIMQRACVRVRYILCPVGGMVCLYCMVQGDEPYETI